MNKKPRLSDPELPRTPAQMAIPSSQSDELNSSSRRLQWPAAVVLPHVDHDGDSSMSTVDSSASSPHHGPANSTFERSSSPLTSVTTPSSEPDTYKSHENVNALADEILERVRLRMRRSPSSPDSDRLLELPAALDDSDDELDKLEAVPIPKPQRTTRAHAPQNSSPEPARPQRTRKQPPRCPQLVTTEAGPSQHKSRNKASNPIDFLLKEKAKADKNSRGYDDLLRAEREANRQAMMDELDDGEDDDWRDELKAHDVAAKRTHWRMSSPASLGDEDLVDLEGVTQAVDVVQRLQVFDEKTGQAIKNIVQSDHANTDAVQMAGIPLWRQDAQAMNTDFVWPAIGDTVQDHQGQPIIRALQEAIKNGNASLVILLLGTGLLSTLDLSQHKAVVEYLCILALDIRSGTSSPALRALLDIWASPSCKAPVGLPIGSALEAVLRLDADPAVLEAAGLAKEGVMPVATDAEDRAETLSILLDMLIASAKAHLVSEADVADWLMLVTVLGMAREPSSHMDGRIVLAIDALLAALGPAETESLMETAICNRLLPFASTLTPVNKGLLATLLAAGSERARRIASTIAFALLTNKTSVENTRLPSGWAVLSILAPPEGTPEELSQRFEVTKETNYEDLAGHVQLLAVVLLDARAFARQELQAYGPRLKQKAENKDDTPLMLVQESAQRLHEAIPDTRAAHLDRTRAKLALKQLMSRVYYQREAVIRSHVAENSDVRNLLMKQGSKPKAKMVMHGGAYTSTAR